MADNSNIDNNSRLAESSSKIRYALLSRNLYDPYVEYPNTNSNTATKVVNSVNNLIGVIKPFSSFNLKNSILGRVAGDNTPLTEIGTVMLAKQFLYNAKSHISQQNLPVIKLSNLFDGSKDTKLFTKNIDLSITKVTGGAFSEILKSVIFNGQTSSNYPFDKDASNDDYLKSTGSGQLNFLFQSLNNNLYKSDNENLIEIGDKNQTPIKTRNNIVNTQSGAIVNTTYKPFFNFTDIKNNPYIYFNPSFFAEIPANQAMARSYLDTEDIQEYAPNKDFVINYFGNTEARIGKYNLNSQISNEWITENIDSNNSNSLIWGRDGLSKEANERIEKHRLRGDKDQVDNNFEESFEEGFFGEHFGDTNFNKFNIKSGLLEYTRNLINATEGRVGDITRKAFLDSDGNVEGFNGSPLWKSNNSIYSRKTNGGNKTGVRQHSVLDQYDRYTKAIRFNGNSVYEGNENSVIYKSVMPRIHPTLPFREGNIPNNKNMMFSIENLAIHVISKDSVGIIDDEFGSQIPICEVGPFNGRIMWFPPYALNFNETSVAKYEPTVMVGRNEPIYTYMNSERSGTISFMLLIDYPDHLKQFHNTDDKEKEIAEFFTFGGNPYIPTDSEENIEKEIEDLQSDIDDLQKGKDIEDPEVIIPEDLSIAFPNAVPSISDNLNTVIDKMYLENIYEIDKNLMSSDGTSFGLNAEIFTKDGIVKDSTTGKKTLDKSLLPVGYTQYDQTRTDDCELNKKLTDFYSNENNRKLYDINIYGRTSLLGSEVYNDALGLRRADATKNFLTKRLEAIFGKELNTLDIKINYIKDGSIGETGGVSSGETAEGIPLRAVKEDRVAYIKFERNEKTLERETEDLGGDDEVTILEKKKQIENLYTKLVRSKRKSYDCVYNDPTEKTKTWNGYSSINENYYNPAYHSQTPEDFHKRLTFLQQCTRQGSAKRYDVPESSNGNITAKNSVFGRQPICILRMGDFIYSKVVIENITIDYQDSPWDTNPEGFGMQPMVANVTLQVKYIGGQSLKGPIDALQNAASFNYYANSNYIDRGMYKRPAQVASDQETYIKGIRDEKKIKKQ